MRALGVTTTAAAMGGAAYVLLVRGDLTLDTGVGRELQPLGPLTVTMAAPRDTVFDVIAAPYLDRTPRAMAAEIEVLDRGTDMVVAAHRTAVGSRLVATTVESVRFERPDTVWFRLLRGPVPHVVERFSLDDDGAATRLTYDGELGTDFWQAGRWWGAQVARTWVATVQSSLDRIRQEAERRAAVDLR